MSAAAGHSGHPILSGENLTLNEPLYRVSGDWHALVMPDHERVFSVDWFAPEFWGERAQPVGEGGRGGAWFVSAADQRWVLRQYHRGGLVARVSRRSYLFTSIEETRPFAELRLLARMHAEGLPVPEPVAAGVQRLPGRRYCGTILIRRLKTWSRWAWFAELWVKIVGRTWAGWYGGFTIRVCTILI